MIPRFDDSGSLPPGIHPATLTEIAERFGHQSELRRVQLESLQSLTELTTGIGVQRIVLNGSFITDIIEPNDVDCVVFIPRGYLINPQTLRELRVGLPFLDITIVRSLKRFDEYVSGIF